MKKIIVILLSLFLVLGLAACAGDAPAPPPEAPAPDAPAPDAPAPDATADDPAEDPPEAATGLIGIIFPETITPRWPGDADHFRAAFEDSPFDEIHILFSEGSVDIERRNVETLVALGADVIVLCAVDGSAAASAAEFARSEGAVLISYDRLIMDTDAVNFHITNCAILTGELMANHLVRNVTGTGNPLYIYAGHPADNNAFLLVEGSWNILQPLIADGTFVIVNSSEAIALQDYPELTREQISRIVNQVATNWSPSDARDLAEAHLTAASDDLKGDVFILAPNDGTALGMAEAFHADPAITSFFITGQDSEVANIQAILDGRLTMTSFRDTRENVRATMNLANQVFLGQTPTTDGYFFNNLVYVPSILLPMHEVTAETAWVLLIDSGFYTEDMFDWP